MFPYHPEKQLPEQSSTVGFRLRLLRTLYGYSQREVAALLNIHRSTYTYYELDKAMPPISAVIALSNHYGVSTDYLLGLGDDEDLFEQPPFRKQRERKLPEE